MAEFVLCRIIHNRLLPRRTEEILIINNFPASCLEFGVIKNMISRAFDQNLQNFCCVGVIKFPEERYLDLLCLTVMPSKEERISFISPLSFQ